MFYGGGAMDPRFTGAQPMQPKRRPLPIVPLQSAPALDPKAYDPISAGIADLQPQVAGMGNFQTQLPQYTPQKGLAGILERTGMSGMDLARMGIGLMQGANPGGTFASGLQGAVDAADMNQERNMRQEQADVWRYGVGRQKAEDQRSDQRLAQARQTIAGMQIADPMERAFAQSNPLEYLQAKGMPIGQLDTARLKQGDRQIDAQIAQDNRTFDQRERFQSQDLAARYAGIRSSERINSFDKAFDTSLGRGDATYLTNLSGVYRDAQRLALPTLQRMRSIVEKYKDDPEFMGNFAAVLADPEAANKVESITRRWPLEKVADFQNLIGDQSFFASEKAKEMKPVTDFDQKIAVKTTAGPQMVAPAALQWIDNRTNEIMRAGQYLDVGREHMKGGRGLGDPDEQGLTYDQKIAKLSGLQTPQTPKAPEIKPASGPEYEKNVRLLRQDTSAAARAEFDAVYGKGAAARALAGSPKPGFRPLGRSFSSGSQ